MIFDLIDPRLIIVVAACWSIGVILKKTPKVTDWVIPYLIVLIGIFFSVYMLGVTAESIIQGILCGAFAVFGHQLFKQTKEGVKK